MITKSDTFIRANLFRVFDLVVATDTVEQVFIRGGDYFLNVAKDGGYDARMIMRRYNSPPSVSDTTAFLNDFDVRAISIPSGADQSVIDAANAAGVVVELHGVARQSNA